MLTHVDSNNLPKMVDVSEKKSTYRVATAVSYVQLPQTVSELLNDGELITKKGPVFQTAIIAGTMAVKKTSELIPFCHPLPIDGCDFKIALNCDNQIKITCKVNSFHRTGVEMEALCGASVAALTVYDMCKAMSHEIVIVKTELIHKKGGRSEYSKS